MQKYNASAWYLLPATLFVCWRQVYRIKIAFTLLPTNRFFSTRTNSMKYLVNWITLRIHVRSRNTLPHLKHGTQTKSVNLHSCGYLNMARAAGLKHKGSTNTSARHSRQRKGVGNERSNALSECICALERLVTNQHELVLSARGLTRGNRDAW